MAWDIVKAVLNKAGDKRLVVCRNGFGLFSWWLEEFFDPCDEDEGQWPEGFWQPYDHGGFYQSADDAELGACAEIAWLRDCPNSN